MINELKLKTQTKRLFGSKGEGGGGPPNKKKTFLDPKEGEGVNLQQRWIEEKKVGEGDPKQNYDKCIRHNTLGKSSMLFQAYLKRLFVKGAKSIF